MDEKKPDIETVLKEIKAMHEGLYEVSNSVIAAVMAASTREPEEIIPRFQEFREKYRKSTT